MQSTWRWRACLARFLAAFSLRSALSWSMSATALRSAGSSTTARFCSSVGRRRAPGTLGLLLNGSAACAPHVHPHASDSLSLPSLALPSAGHTVQWRSTHGMLNTE